MANSFKNTFSARSLRWLRVIAIDVAIFLVVYLAIQWWLGRNTPTGPAPDLRGVTVNAEHLSLSDFRGQPVLLHFWASWCGICRFEHSTIDSIAEDHTVITILTRSGTEAEARQYLQEHNIRARVILDENGQIADQYHVRGVPASFIIDPAGNITDVELGYTSELGLRLRLWFAGW